MSAFGWAYTAIAVVVIAAVLEDGRDLSPAADLAIVALPVTLLVHGAVTLRSRRRGAR